MSDYLSPKEIAEGLQVSVRTVMRAINSGELRASQLAARGCWRVRPDDLEAWIDLRANRPREHHVPDVTGRASSGRRPKRGARERSDGILRVPRMEDAA